MLEKNNKSGCLPAEYKYLDDVYGAFGPLLFPFGLRMFVFCAHLAECCEIAVLALHQELGRDVSGWFDFAGFLILLMELLNPLFSRHHLEGSKISERYSRDEEKSYAIDPTFFQGTIPFSLTLTMEELGTTFVPTMLLIITILATFVAGRTLPGLKDPCYICYLVIL